MTLYIVTDTHTQGHAIYIEGVLRGEWDEGGLTPDELMTCYKQFAHMRSVKLRSLEVDSQAMGFYIESDSDDGYVEWPEHYGELLEGITDE